MKSVAASVPPSLHRCRLCGATSYRPVIARDERGAMRPTARYQCSGCSLVFSDRRTWWTNDEAPASGALHERAAAHRLVCDGAAP